MTVQSGDRAAPRPLADDAAHFAPTLQAYTTDHRLPVKLLSVPTPIPFGKYFTIRLGVYDGQNLVQQRGAGGLATGGSGRLFSRP
jgi:hypothetical protein